MWHIVRLGCAVWKIRKSCNFKLQQSAVATCVTFSSSEWWFGNKFAFKAGQVFSVSHHRRLPHPRLRRQRPHRTHALSRWVNKNINGRSPGLVVLGGGSSSDGHRFESRPSDHRNRFQQDNVKFCFHVSWSQTRHSHKFEKTYVTIGNEIYWCVLPKDYS